MEDKVTRAAFDDLKATVLVQQDAITTLAIALKGLLLALDGYPHLAVAIGAQIGARAEQRHAEMLGSPVSDEVLDRRRRLLRDLLPPHVQAAANLQK
jgi:hypothetical protein